MIGLRLEFGVALGLTLDRFPFSPLTGHERNGTQCPAGQTGLQKMLAISEKIDGCDARPPPSVAPHIRLFTRRLFDVL